MDGDALDDAVHGAGGARRVGRVAHAHGVEQGDDLRDHDEREREVALGQRVAAGEGERVAREERTGVLLEGTLRRMLERACSTGRDA